MPFDPISGKHFSGPDYAEMLRGRELAMRGMLDTSRRQAEAERLRREEVSEVWDGFIPGSTCVLISKTASRKNWSCAATPRGLVDLDGLLVSISPNGHQGQVRVHFASPKKDQLIVSVIVNFAREDLSLLGHGFSIWEPRQMQEIAEARDRRNNRRDGWASQGQVKHWTDA